MYMKGQEKGDVLIQVSTSQGCIAIVWSILRRILHYMYARIYFIFMINFTVTIECLHISELLLKLHVFARVTSLQCFHNCIVQ